MEQRNNAYARQRISRFLTAVARLVFFIGMAYVLLYPLLMMLSRSVRTQADLLNASVFWIPSGITFDNFKTAAKFLNYNKTFPFSTYIVMISTVFSLISCSMAGYAIGRYRLKIRGIALLICVFNLLIPMQTYIIPYFFEMKNFTFWGMGYLVAPFNGGAPFTISLLNTEWTYFLPAATGAGIRSGLYVLLFVQGYSALPQELEDAAKIDGCSHFSTYLKIMVPNMTSSFLVVFLLSVVWNWSEYYYPTMMLGDNAVLSTALVSLRDNVGQALFTSSSLHATTQGELSVIMFAGALLFILPVFMLYTVLQRRFTEGMERTGIVG